MRKFSSYGPLETAIHYYAPRTALINEICAQLLGDDPAQGGHYVTIWAPRQTGKSWIMQQALRQLNQQSPEFAVAKLNVQDLEDQDVAGVYQGLIAKLALELNLPLPLPTNQTSFAECFARNVLPQPLILLIDEFDALSEEAIHAVVSVFRNIYIHRRDKISQHTTEKHYQLHSLALIGVRSVLGVENSSGSPFNVQRSVHIPNLSQAEVDELFRWYTAESGQPVAQTVIDQLYNDMRGQPGLTCWLGELLTQTYNEQPTQPITEEIYQEAYAAAVKLLPNNNILNIISKADQPSYRQIVLNLFKTDAPQPFRYDDRKVSYLYNNGIIAPEKVGSTEYYTKFANPFVQKRLFYYFARELFPNLDRLYDPFDALDDTISDTTLNILTLLRRYERYLQANRDWLFKDAPRRSTDERIFEAVYHFNLFMYLAQFLQSFTGSVTPEFPTGNGKLDLLVRYADQIYGIEVKSFVNRYEYTKVLQQAAHYAQQLHLQTITLVFFVEQVDEKRRQEFEAHYLDTVTQVTVQPLLIATGR